MWSFYWLIDWLIDWWGDWLIDWLLDWLIGWLVDWLIDWLIAVWLNSIRFTFKSCTLHGQYLVTLPPPPPINETSSWVTSLPIVMQNHSGVDRVALGIVSFPPPTCWNVGPRQSWNNLYRPLNLLWIVWSKSGLYFYAGYVKSGHFTVAMAGPNCSHGQKEKCYEKELRKPTHQ